MNPSIVLPGWLVATMQNKNRGFKEVFSCFPNEILHLLVCLLLLILRNDSEQASREHDRKLIAFPPKLLLFFYLHYYLLYIKSSNLPHRRAWVVQYLFAFASSSRLLIPVGYTAFTPCSSTELSLDHYPLVGSGRLAAL